MVVTRDGRVYQMGSTGAHNPEEEKAAGKSPAWEGAVFPTLVDGNLFGLFVEQVRAHGCCWVLLLAAAWVPAVRQASCMRMCLPVVITVAADPQWGVS